MSDDDSDLKITHPHDHFFHKVFKDRDNSISLVKDYLPSEVTRYMDLSGLKIENQRFVDRSLKTYESDLWLSVPLVKGFSKKKAKGRKAFIHVIAESQTQPDKTMPFRLLSYMCKIWEQELEAGKPISPIIPLVISQKTWPYSPSFTDMMDLDPKLQQILSPWLPSFQHLLIELAKMDDFPGRLNVQMAFSLLKFGQRQHDNPSDYESLGEIIHELSRDKNAAALLALCLHYVANTANIDGFSALKETIRTHSFENRGEEIVTTYIQHYEETLANTQQALYEKELLLKQERLDKARVEQEKEQARQEQERERQEKEQARQEQERERQEKEQARQEQEHERQEKERLAQKLRDHGIDPDA